MSARLAALLVWAAVLAGAVAWGLPLFTRGTPVPAGASLATAAPPAGAGLARLLGQAPPAPVAEAPVVVTDTRFQLLGVVAPRRGSASGLALISVDGKPARAIGVGRELEPGLRLLTVGHREVQLGAAAGAPAVTLTLPPLAEAQRGRPGETPAGLLPGQSPGVPVFGANAMPGAMRVPALPMVQAPRLPPVPVPQGAPQGMPPAFPQQPGMGQSDDSPGRLPYQPDVNGNPVPTLPPPAAAPRNR